jgi:hypothetical protein
MRLLVFGGRFGAPHPAAMTRAVAGKTVGRSDGQAVSNSTPIDGLAH